MNSKSVFRRLAVAFIVLIAITVGVGWLGLDRMAMMNAEVNQALEKRYAILMTSQTALKYSSLNNRITMQVFLLTDKAAIDTLLVERAANSAKISALVKDIETRLDSEEEKKLLLEVIQKRTPYIESYLRALGKLKANSFEDARNALISDTLPRLVAYHGAWNAFVEYQAERARHEGVEAEAKYVSARHLVGGMVAIGAVLAAIIAAFASQTVRREIHVREEAQNALREAGAQLEARVQGRTRELSRLNAELTVEVDHRKQAEATLLAERERFQNLMDFMPDNIYFKDLQSRFTLVNAAFARSLRLASPNDAIGKTDLDIFGGEHSHQAFNAEQALMATGDPIIGLEEREDHLDGRVTWVSTTKVALRDSKGSITGMVGISRNVTERKEAEAAFLESARKYQALIESVSDWVWETNASLQYVYSNPKVSTVLGYDMGQILGRSLCDFLPGVEQSQISALFESLNRADQSKNIFDCLCLHKDGNVITLEMNVAVIVEESGQVRGFRGVARDVTERRRFEEELIKLTRALDQSPASVVITDTRGKIEYVNARFCEITGYMAQELLGKNPRILNSGLTSNEVYKQLWGAICRGREWRGEICNRKKTGELFWESAIISPLKNDQGTTTHYLGVKEDVTERKRLEKERETMEIQLRHAQKLESVGQLAAGIAHEINTPIQYVGDNLRFLDDSFSSVERLISQYQKSMDACRECATAAQALAELDKTYNEIDFDYLRSEIPTSIKQSLEGVGRVSKIVRAMKEFSHPGSKEKSPTDLNRAIETTLTVARNEWKYVAEVQTDFAPDMPLVPCLPDEFNQVMLNLIVNAAHAIGDVVKKQNGDKGTIRITTRHEGSWAEIRVSDTGSGIPEDIRHRIFEPFFTTKEVGKGTGQGLTIARSTIVKKHGGELTFESRVGEGTTFIVRLPLSPGGGTMTTPES